MRTDDEIDQLIKEAHSGSESALAELFDGYRSRLTRMIKLRMDPRLRARIDEDDVLQEAYLELSRKLRNYSRVDKVPFFLWLRMTTGEMLIDLHRKHLGAEMRTAKREIGIYRRVPNASTFFLASKLAGNFTSVDRQLIREEVMEKLQDSLNKMDDDDREILAMRHYEELSSDEIATVLGLTRSGVLKRVTRALRKLRAAVQSDSDLKL